MYCISTLGLSFAVQFCLHIVFYPVALCIVVFCCFPLLAVGDLLSAGAYFWAVFSVWGFVPPLVFEALSSFCWGLFLMLHQGFVLVFYTEASFSYFILRLCPHILFWGFVLIFYIEALSSFFYIWGYVPQFEALVLIVVYVGPFCFVCTTCLVCLQWYVCGSVCLHFLFRITRCQYHLVWISIHIFFYVLCLFLVFIRAIRY